MADFLSFNLLCLLLFLYLSSASGHHKPTHIDNPSLKQTSNIIHEACKASPYPACEAWLSNSSHVPPNASVLQVIRNALNITKLNLDMGRVSVQNIRDSAGNLNRTNTAKICLDLVHYSKYRIQRVDRALRIGKLEDARAWMSAALVYQYDCWSALKYVNDTLLVARTMDFFNSSLIPGSSSALGMLVNYDLFGENTTSWGPAKTERDGFWETVQHSSGSGVTSSCVLAGLKPNVTVSKSGGEGGYKYYKTVQEAVNAAPNNSGPGKPFVIWIRAGVYDETVRVPLEKKNVVFLGDGMGKTIITGSNNVGQLGMSTYESATVGVVGEGFMASNLTIENTAGPDAHQAVAFRSDSDHSVIENCEFVGNQDTLYAHTLRQYYKSCRIQGNVDFIFGNSAALFQDCLILVAPRQLSSEEGETNTVTAQGRTDPAQSTGFVFKNSVINGTEKYMDLYNENSKIHMSYLGRPWKEYSRTVFIGCTLEALIVPDGWLKWDGEFALKTLYYGEFNNTGAGSSLSKRVDWSSQIPEHHLGSYSPENFIQAN